MPNSSPENLKGDLLVSVAALKTGLRQARAAKAFSGQPAQLTFDESSLIFSLGGFHFAVPATGYWSGEVLVAANFLKQLGQGPLLTDHEIRVSTDGVELTIGMMFVGCEWHGLEYPRLELPLDARLCDVLALRWKYSETDIARSGLSDRFCKAEADCTQLIDKTVEPLRPLGVSRRMIQNMVDSALKALAGTSSATERLTEHSRMTNE